MTILANYSIRASLGIDSLERNIAYAAFLLRAANQTLVSTSKYYNAVQIAMSQASTDTGVAAVLSIAAKFPYQSAQFLKSGGDLLSNLGKFSDVDPNPFLVTTASTVNSQVPATPPDNVVTLEQFFVWSAFEYQKKIIPDVQSATIAFLEQDTLEPSLSVKIALPFEWDIYLRSRNFIQAIKVITGIVGPGGDGSGDGSGNVLMGNSGHIGNTGTIGN
jgi:hypothetical protein